MRTLRLVGPQDACGTHVAAAVAGQHLVADTHQLDWLDASVAHGHARALDKALVVVADDRDVAVLAGDQLEPAVLGVVGVLVLVDEDVAECGCVALADLGEQLHHVDRAHEQVVEVHRVHAVQLGLVHAIDVDDRLLEVRPDELAVALRVAQLVLCVGDLAMDRRGCEALRVDVELLDAALHEPARVGLVVDRELARVAEPVRVRAQHACAGGVKRHQPHRARPGADEQLDPLAHLLRRLVRERDREDLVGPRLPGREQVRDPVRQHARLARARAGEDQQRPLAVQDRRALRLVEPAQQAVELGVGVPGGGGFHRRIRR